MPIQAQFLTRKGTLSPKWKEDEQFHIYVKTVNTKNEKVDLAFLSGYADPKIFMVEANEWYRDTLVINFDGLRWMKNEEVTVVPVVTLATISNMDAAVTDVCGWGVDFTNYEVIDGPANTDFKTIRLTSNLAICGDETYLNRVAYYVVAMGKIRK